VKNKQINKLVFVEVNNVNRDDAFYYLNLLKLGYVDKYDEWLNYYLETENPLSDIVLALATCGSNPEISIRLLQEYCSEQPLNQTVITEKFRLFFKEAYYSNWMNQEEILSVVKKLLRQGIGCSAEGTDFDTILDMYDLAKDGIIENFDELFLLFLEG